jgi:ABC-type nitrate/sulfonate/bicarbonate transport system substrate-binding protein
MRILRHWKTRVIACGLAAASCVAVGGMASTEAAVQSSGSGSSASQYPFNYGIFIQPSALLAAIKLGYFDNMKVNPIQELTGAASLPLMQSGRLAGQAEVAPLPLILALNEGISVKVVWVASKTYTDFALKKGITKMSQLDGKSLGAPLGSIDEFLMKQYIVDHGGNLSKINFVNLNPADLVAAYKTGQIVGATWAPPASTEMIADGGYLVNAFPVVVQSIFSGSFVAAHPAAVQAFVCDIANAQQHFIANPNTAWKALGKALGEPLSSMPSLFPADFIAPADEAGNVTWRMSNTSTLAATYAIGQQMAAAGLVTKAPTMAQVQAQLDPTFALKVAQGKCPSSS